MTLVKSKQRVTDHGEVFTPAWMVRAMLDLVQDESERIDARFLEPACGSGNFLVQIAQRKLTTARLKYGPCDFNYPHYALLGIMSIYGIELLHDNIIECRANVLAVFAQALQLSPTDDLYRAATAVLSLNLVHGDAQTLQTQNLPNQPIIFAEWHYLGNGTYQRRDFCFSHLSQTAAHAAADRQNGSLFLEESQQAEHIPLKIYPPMTVQDLAAFSLLL